MEKGNEGKERGAKERVKEKGIEGNRCLYYSFLSAAK